MPERKPLPGSYIKQTPDGRTTYGDDRYEEPVFLTHQLAYMVVVRLAGTAADKHTILVTEGRYDRVGKAMQLARLTLVHCRQVPAGNLKGLGTQIESLRDKAKKLTPAIDVEINADVTRSPLAYDNIPGDPGLFLIATTGLDRYAAPYRYIGRLLILSSMQVMLRAQKLRIALPVHDDDVTVVTSGRLETALSNVELKTPKADTEEVLLDSTGPDDDLAITAGLSLLLGEERLISPEDLRFHKKLQEQRDRWVV